MKLTSTQISTIKSLISVWIDEVYSLDNKNQFSKLPQVIRSAITEIDMKLNTYCADQGIFPYVTLDELRAYRGAIPTTGHDQAGLRCEALIEHLPSQLINQADVPVMYGTAQKHSLFHALPAEQRSSAEQGVELNPAPAA